MNSNARRADTGGSRGSSPANQRLFSPLRVVHGLIGTGQQAVERFGFSRGHGDASHAETQRGRMSSHAVSNSGRDFELMRGLRNVLLAELPRDGKLIAADPA